MNSITLCGSGIYKIVNSINGKIYIGSAVNLKRRTQKHLFFLRSGTHPNRYLQNAFVKYGESCFSFEVVLLCHKENLLLNEQKYIDELKPEYNLSPTASSNLGIRYGKVARKNMSLAHIGKTLSEDQKQKIGKANKGKIVTQQTRIKIGNIHRGLTHSEEAKRKMSDAHKGNKTWLGLVHSDESKEKMSKAKLGKKLPDETRKNMSNAVREWWRKRKEGK